MSSLAHLHHPRLLVASLALVALAVSTFGVCFCCPMADAAEPVPSCHLAQGGDGPVIASLDASCCQMGEPSLPAMAPDARPPKMPPASVLDQKLAHHLNTFGLDTTALHGAALAWPDAAPPPLTTPPCFELPLRV